MEDNRCEEDAITAPPQLMDVETNEFIRKSITLLQDRPPVSEEPPPPARASIDDEDDTSLTLVTGEILMYPKLCSHL